MYRLTTALIISGSVADAAIRISASITDERGAYTINPPDANYGWVNNLGGLNNAGSFYSGGALPGLFRYYTTWIFSAVSSSTITNCVYITNFVGNTVEATIVSKTVLEKLI